MIGDTIAATSLYPSDVAVSRSLCLRLGAASTTWLIIPRYVFIPSFFPCGRGQEFRVRVRNMFQRLCLSWAKFYAVVAARAVGSRWVIVFRSFSKILFRLHSLNGANLRNLRLRYLPIYMVSSECMFRQQAILPWDKTLL